MKSSDLVLLELKAESQTGTVGTLANPYYIIAVMNISDYTIREVSSDRGASFVSTPDLPKNCDGDLQRCFNEGKYTPVLTVACGDQVDLVLRGYKGDAKMTQSYEPFVADCTHKGGIVVYSNP